MTLPDPRDTPTMSVPDAGALLGLGRSASYAAAARGALPVIDLTATHRVVPTAKLLAVLGIDDGRAGSPIVADALAASALELRAAADDVLPALRRLLDAVAGAQRLAAALIPDNVEARSATERAADTDTDSGGPRGQGNPLRAV